MFEMLTPSVDADVAGKAPSPLGADGSQHEHRISGGQLGPVVVLGFSFFCKKKKKFLRSNCSAFRNLPQGNNQRYKQRVLIIIVKHSKHNI